MKSFLLACVCVLATATVAAAQTPMGTPPSSTTSPAATTTTAPRPDATIETQSNSSAVQTSPGDRASSRKAMHNDRMMKRKNNKTKMKGQTNSTM